MLRPVNHLQVRIIRPASPELYERRRGGEPFHRPLAHAPTEENTVQNRLGIVAIVLVSGLAGGSVAGAQSLPREVSVYGLASRASTWDDEGSLGSGMGLGGGITVGLTTAVAVEVDLLRGRHERMTSDGGLRWQGTPIIATAGVRYRFGGGRVRPYVSGGAGVLRYSGSFTEARPIRLPPGATTADYPMRTVSRSGSAFVMAGGLGVEIDIANGWFVQPDARLVLTNPDNPQPLFFVTRSGVSFGYRWR